MPNWYLMIVLLYYFKPSLSPCITLLPLLRKLPWIFIFFLNGLPHWSLHMQLLLLSQLMVTRVISSLDIKFPFWHEMLLLVRDLCLKPWTSSFQDRSTQSQSIVECTLQTLTGMSIMVQVVIIDWFISKRICGWWIKWTTNDIKDNIKCRHKSTIFDTPWSCSPETKAEN